MIRVILLALLPGLAAAQVVARVQGPQGAFEITAERLQAYLQANPERDKQGALQDLIDFELLAAEASTRGYPAAALAEDVKPVLVLRWMKDHLEQEVQRETIPKVYLERAYQQNIDFFVRPELRTVDHILVTVGGKLPEEKKAAAEALGRKIRASFDAEPVNDRESFRNRVGRFVPEAEAAGLQVRAEALGTFALKGQFIPKFSETVFKVTTPNTIMQPFDTRFGVHVVRVDGVHEAQDVKFEQAIDQLRDRTLKGARQFELARLAKELADQVGVVVDPSPLEQVAARRGIDTPEE